MKKYFNVITAIALFFTFVIPASAARLVPGRVPQATPLQPLPEAIAPNVSENIDAQYGADGLPETGDEENAQDQNADGEGIPDGNGQPEREAGNAASAGASGGLWLKILAVVLVAGGLAMIFWKKLAGEENKAGKGQNRSL